MNSTPRIIQRTTIFGRYLRRFTRIYPAIEIPPNNNGCLNDSLCVIEFGTKNHSKNYYRRGVICVDLQASIRQLKYHPTRWMFKWFLVYYLSYIVSSSWFDHIYIIKHPFANQLFFQIGTYIIFFPPTCINNRRRFIRCYNKWYNQWYIRWFIQLFI